MNNEKIKSFGKAVKSRGYTIREFPIDQESYVVVKDDFYYVRIDYREIFEAPEEVLLDYIEEEFKRLEKEHTMQ
jgi:transposase